MAGLQHVRKVVVRAEHLRSTRQFLQDMGHRGLEGLLVWAGVVIGDRCDIRSVIAPQQKARSTKHGLLVSVDADGLHELNEHMYRANLRLIAQVHSHGEHAYHSDTDNEYSIVTALGGISIVVPHFAQEEIVLSQCAVYRLQECGWVQLQCAQVEDFIEAVI